MKQIVLKWFDRLKFPKEWREDIAKAVKRFSLKQDMRLPLSCLIRSLYDCEALFAYYHEKKIPEEILIHTLSDLLIWTKNHHQMTGELGIAEVDWVRCHLEGRLFRLGRLQFCMGEAEQNCERLGIKKGEHILEVHIPQGEPLTPEACRASLERAVIFFETYFPDYAYVYFTCHSWMLDYHLREFLPADSNIIRFQDMFDVFSYEESRQAIKYLFTLQPSRKKHSALQEKVLAHTNAGGSLCEGYGVISKASVVSNRC